MAKPTNHNKNWTAEQDEILEEYFGVKDVSWIAKKVGKTEIATNKRIKKILKLDPESTYIQLVEVARQLQIPRATVYRWAEKGDLPHYKIILAFERKRYFVDMEEMWKWLKDNPTKWNAAKLEPFAFGYEPDWVNAKRREDRPYINQGKHWTKEEKEKAWVMWAAGRSNEEIAAVFSRTPYSIEIMLQFYRAEKAGKSFRDRRYDNGQRSIKENAT